MKEKKKNYFPLVKGFINTTTEKTFGHFRLPRELGTLYLGMLIFAKVKAIIKIRFERSHYHELVINPW